jgi:hypothetical protein
MERTCIRTRFILRWQNLAILRRGMPFLSIELLEGWRCWVGVFIAGKGGELGIGRSERAELRERWI